MIDFGKILKRAWYILWNYKVLWIFGILLALTTGGGGGNGGNGNSNYQFNNNDVNRVTGPDLEQAGPLMRELVDWFNQDVVPLFERPSEHIATFIWIGVAVLLFILVVGVITALIRYPSEAAVIRMVDEFEQSETKLGFKQGWKLGWTRRAFRIWVVDLILGLPALLYLALMLTFGVIIFLGYSEGSSSFSIAATITIVGLFFLLTLAFILLMVFLGLLRHFFIRFAALEETGVIESLRQGWAFFKKNWKSAALMWLIMLGIGLGFGIASLFLFLLLIPVYLILLVPALLAAAVPGLLVFGLASLFTSWPLALIVGVIIALPVFFTVFFAPLFLIGGWFQIFDSSVWTLAYREMKALGVSLPAEATAEVV